MSEENKQVFVGPSRRLGWARALRPHTEGPVLAQPGAAGPALSYVVGPPRPYPEPSSSLDIRAGQSGGISTKCPEAFHIERLRAERTLSTKATESP